MVLSGIAADAIVGVALELGAQLIVTGTHGRTGMRHTLLGSIAERVVRTAHCPVLTVRAPRPKN
jgi:nucleotide-binding universal stress UspA family protein